eukprot:scaffold105484_cov28-Tisochrysis_lutea.AAC.8
MGTRGAQHLVSALMRNRKLMTLKCAPTRRAVPSSSAHSPPPSSTADPLMSAAPLPCPQPQPKRDSDARQRHDVLGLGSRGKSGAHNAR